MEISYLRGIPADVWRVAYTPNSRKSGSRPGAKNPVRLATVVAAELARAA
jgi:hypothetical protein